MSKFFRLVSRALLACLLVVVWFAPPAVAETVCEATDDGWDCNIVVDTFNQGPQFTFTLAEETEVTVRTFTSLTCDDWETEQGTDLYAADPVLSLFDDTGALLFQDDDSAEHNDGTNFCWDALLVVTLDAGDYMLQADAYNEATTGVYSLEILGGEWSVPQAEPEPTPTPTPPVEEEPEPTPTPEPEPEPEPTPDPSPTPIPPTPEPDPTPEEVPEATPEEPELPEVPELPEEEPTPEELPPEEVYEPPVEEVWQPPVVIIEIEEEEEYPYDYGSIFEDVDWEDFEDFNFDFEEDSFDLEDFEEFEEGQEELVVEEEIFDEELVDEPISEEDEAEEEEETAFVDEGEQEERFELVPDVGLEEQDFEDLEVEDLDGETLIEILQDEDAAEEFFEEVIEDNPDFFEESSEEELEEVFEAAPELFNEMPDEVKEEFEEDINIFAGGFEDYLAEDSTITVQERRVVVTASTVSAVAAARPTVRPMPAPTAGGPSIPQGGRRR